MDFRFTSRYLHIEPKTYSLLGSSEYLRAHLQICGSGSYYVMTRDRKQ